MNMVMKKIFVHSILLLMFSVFAGVMLFSCSKSSTEPEGQGANGGGDKPAEVFKRSTNTSNGIEYRTGNVPVIFSAPHGGSQEGTNLTKRTSSNCPDPDFATVRDDKTVELANMIDSIFYAKTGKYPYIVIAHVSRKYVDFNRKKVNACPKNSPNNEYVWDVYHNWIKKAEEYVEKDFGSGLLLDIHGQSHAVKQVEIGYCLSSSELGLSDAKLSGDGKYLDDFSMNRLVRNNKSGSSFVDLLRGPYSLGSLMYKNGLACVPHSSNPSPGNLPYFNGGYITYMYGSSDEIGMIDAVQLEFDNVSRLDENRKKTATALVDAVVEFINTHYKVDEL